MRTEIHPDLVNLAEVQEADDILRKCVHCGFCTATCPTYQLLGDELDGPRGRIYLIKDLLETNELSQDSRVHLDRCLTCRSCETTCPSGVEYGRLLDIGRGFAAELQPAPPVPRVISNLLRTVIPRKTLFKLLLEVGQLFRPLLPKTLRQQVPKIRRRAQHFSTVTSNRVLLLSGCVQSAATPSVVKALREILASLDIGSEVLNEGCCGAVDYHLGAHEIGRDRMRRLIDDLYDRLDDVDHIVSSASGCGVTIKEYPQVLQHDAVYAERARMVSQKVVDAAELIDKLPVQIQTKVAVHTPCTMQHGMKLNGVVEALLAAAGAEVVKQKNAHLCCGSAGTYSILQPELSEQLRDKKVAALIENKPDVIVTANIGCQLQLDEASDVPVMHWLEFVADQLATR